MDCISQQTRRQIAPDSAARRASLRQMFDVAKPRTLAEIDDVVALHDLLWVHGRIKQHGREVAR